MHVLVFDSGIGGVSVATCLRETMPGAALTYLMDDAGFPYGDREEADLNMRIPGVIGAGIEACRPQMVVVACNTASITALYTLRARYDLPFIGCVPPVKSAASASATRTIGVLATPATARGAYLRALVAAHAADCRVLIHGAPGLAQFAERCFAGEDVPPSSVRQEIAGLLAQPGSADIDAIALGCTHYGLLLPELRACFPDHVSWHDPALPVARQAARVAETLPATIRPDSADGLLLTTGRHALDPGHGWRRAGFMRHAFLPVDGLADYACKTSGAAA